MVIISTHVLVDEIRKYKNIIFLQGSIIDSTSVYAEDYDLANIFKTYTERNGKNKFLASYDQHTYLRMLGSVYVFDIFVPGKFDRKYATN